MNAILLAAVLIWPSDCEQFGQLYLMAATVRDRGVKRDDALSKAKSRQARLALIHVYERADMSAQDWRWLAVGICVGQRDASPQRMQWKQARLT